MEPTGPTAEDAAATVLIVDDEPGLADLYAAWLDGPFETLLAYDGEAAFDALATEPDVVLLDRRMPDTTGDDVLEEIGRRDLDCGVAMVTAVEPDFDVIEMGFDDYLIKPVSQEDLIDVVESLLAVRQYDDTVGELYQLCSKRTALRSQKSLAELEGSEAYQTLLADIERVKQAADATVERATSRDPESLFRRFPSGPTEAC